MKIPKTVQQLQNSLSSSLRAKQRENGGREASRNVVFSASLRPQSDFWSSFSFAENAGIYANHPWVQKAVRIIANTVAPLELKVYDENGFVEQHVLYRLFSRVNPVSYPAQFWQEWVISMLLAGEAFIEIVRDRRGIPVEMWLRRADRMIIRVDESTSYPRIIAYVYEDNGVRNVLSPDSVVFSRFVNPLSNFRGISPLMALRRSIRIDMFAQAWSEDFLRNNARPDFAIITPAGITPSEKQSLIAQLRAEHQGKAYEPIVLEEGVIDIKPFSWAPKDIEWLEQRKFSRDEIGAVFGVPDEIMGYGRDTYENFETAHQVFWLLTILPLLNLRDSTLTHYFRNNGALLADNQRIATDVQNVPVLREDMRPNVEMAVSLMRAGVPFSVVNERFGLNMRDFPGSDVSFLTAFDTNRRFSVLNVDISETAEGRAFDHPLIVSKQFEMIDEDAERRLVLERRFMEALLSVFERELREVMRSIRETGNPPQLDRASYTTLFTQFIAEAARLGVDTAADPLIAIGFGFDKTAINAYAIEWARQYVFTAYNSGIDMAIVMENAERIKRIMTVWLESGGTLRDLREKLVEIVYDPFRAEMIAVTETTNAINNGMILAWQRANAEFGTSDKPLVVGYRWVTANDEKVCRICGVLGGITFDDNGNVKPVSIERQRENAVFAPIGDYFVHPGGPGPAAIFEGMRYKCPPAHPRCRCRLFPVLYRSD